jgi:hypothetical protein
MRRNFKTWVGPSEFLPDNIFYSGTDNGGPVVWWSIPIKAFLVDALNGDEADFMRNHFFHYDGPSPLSKNG